VSIYDKPLVIVRHGPFMSREELGHIKEHLKRFCSAALDCSATEERAQGGLTFRDINVCFWEYGPSDDKEFTLYVLIIAKHYPTRAETIQDRAEIIREKLCEELGDDFKRKKVGILAICPPAGWVENYASRL